MNNQLPQLILGDVIVPVPVIQGGMGVGVSRSRLAGAVAKEGGIGVIQQHRSVMTRKILKKIRRSVTAGQ